MLFVILSTKSNFKEYFSAFIKITFPFTRKIPEKDGKTAI